MLESYEWIMVLFTGVIAVSTVVYTFYSHKLWKATRISSDIARYNSFMAYLTTLFNEAARVRESRPEAAAFYEQLAVLITEVGVKRFMEEINLKKNPEVRDYFNKVEGMLRAKGIDPNTVPWMRPIKEQMDK